jgi:hypothetical protein
MKSAYGVWLYLLKIRYCYDLILEQHHLSIISRLRCVRLWSIPEIRSRCDPYADAASRENFAQLRQQTFLEANTNEALHGEYDLAEVFLRCL